MRTPRKIPYSFVKAYLGGEIDRPDEQINEICRENPAAEMLLRLIEKLKEKISPLSPRETKEMPPAIATFPEIDAMLPELLGGDISPEAAQAFARQLLASPLFYDKVWIKLAQIDQMLSAPETPEVEAIPRMSFEDIIERAGIPVRPPGPKTAPEQKKTGNLLQFYRDLKLAWAQLNFRYAVAAAAALALLVMVYVSREFIFKTTQYPYQYFVYDDRLPYDFDSNTLRGPQTVEEPEDALLQSFIADFTNTMAGYLTRDYEGTIEKMKSLEPRALALQTPAADSLTFINLREYYFYWGLSSLAFSRDKSLSLDAGKQYLDRAIALLGQAARLTESKQLAGEPKERYFLGVACYFKGDDEKASPQFRSIETTSKFYKDSQKLLKEIQRRQAQAGK